MGEIGTSEWVAERLPDYSYTFKGHATFLDSTQLGAAYFAFADALEEVAAASDPAQAMEVAHDHLVARVHEATDYEEIPARPDNQLLLTLTELALWLRKAVVQGGVPQGLPVGDHCEVMGFLFTETETQLRAQSRIESLRSEIDLEGVAIDAPDYAGRMVPCLALVGPNLYIEIGVREARLADMFSDEGLGGVPRELPPEEVTRLRHRWAERRSGT